MVYIWINYIWILAYLCEKITVYNCAFVTSETDEEASSDSREQSKRNYITRRVTNSWDYLTIRVIGKFSVLFSVSLFCPFLIEFIR